MALCVEVMAVGDELTTGQRLDTNSQWLSEQLTSAGCHVGWHTTVGDDLARHIAAFRVALGRADVVVCTGGLGPTADDLTRDALAVAAELPLERHADCLVHIRALFAQRGRPMPASNERQADLPRGAAAIPNAHGTAPGIDLACDAAGRRCRVFALPGVPAEMKPMWAAYVAPAVQALRPTPRTTVHRRLKCFGAGESELEAMIPELIARGREPLVGITVSDATITLRITASGPNAAACEAAMAPTVQQIRTQLGDLVFGEEDDELHDAVLRLLAERGSTLATAEWGTAGVLAQWLATAEGAGREAFVGGRVVTGPALGRDGSAAPFAADSRELAADLAQSAQRHYGADYGLGVAAYPPAVDARDARVGVAIAAAQRVWPFALPCATHPAIRRQRTAKQALNALRKLLLQDRPTASLA